MHYAARGSALLVSVSFLCGCEVLWAPYIGTFETPSAVADLGAVADLSAIADLSAVPLCDPTDPTLILCLTFDGQLVDGTSNKIAITGGPVDGYVPGAIGQAALFGVKTPTVSLGDSAAWNVSEYTFEAWVRPDEKPTGTLNRFGLMDRQAGYSMFLYGNVDPGSVALRCAFNDVTTQALQIPIGRFSHIACTFKSGEQILYLNGKQEFSDTKSVQTPPPALLPHYLGSNVQSPPGDVEAYTLVGALDEIRLFSQVRTAAQIRASYERGSAALR